MTERTNKFVPSISVSYAHNGSTTKANILGMRQMQERAYEKRGEQYLLIKSPPASGKSRALMFIALDKDESGRRITTPTAGPLFTHESDDEDIASGTIYVLRSKSDHPLVAANRDVLHKIGVTGGEITRRLANAKLDPTFLMADVEVVATYTLYNINRARLENLIHRIFSPARLDIEIKDRFGNPIVPREWFLVPRFVIDDAVEGIKDGTITGYVYDPQTARLVKRGDLQ